MYVNDLREKRDGIGSFHIIIKWSKL